MGNLTNSDNPDEMHEMQQNVPFYPVLYCLLSLKQ